jgi:hypothetical protein
MHETYTKLIEALKQDPESVPAWALADVVMYEPELIEMLKGEAFEAARREWLVQEEIQGIHRDFIVAWMLDDERQHQDELEEDHADCIALVNKLNAALELCGVE